MREVTAFVCRLCRKKKTDVRGEVGKESGGGGGGGLRKRENGGEREMADLIACPHVQPQYSMCNES